MRKGIVLLLAGWVLLAAGCGGTDTEAGQLDYDQTKKMLVDILKTDEGKKAIKDVMADEEMKRQLVMDQAAVNKTIEKTLTSEKGREFWKKSFEDPKFAASMAKSMKEEHEKLMKGLMKDPDYQALMMDILQDPSFQKDMAKALKSKEFRKQMQEVVTDTLESPLYKEKIEDLLLKAAEKAGKEEKKKE